MTSRRRNSVFDTSDTVRRACYRVNDGYMHRSDSFRMNEIESDSPINLKMGRRQQKSVDRLVYSGWRGSFHITLARGLIK